jgi:hypothetical protein
VICDTLLIRRPVVHAPGQDWIPVCAGKTDSGTHMRGNDTTAGSLSSVVPPSPFVQGKGCFSAKAGYLEALWHNSSIQRSDVTHLYYIFSIVNLGSIADPSVQDRREKVRVPGRNGSRELHSYANLYFNARNAMMYRRLDCHAEICVVQVSPEILDLPDVVLTDCNAASGWCKFLPSPNGLNDIDGNLVFAHDWRSPDQVEYYRRESAVNAEVLVPDVVGPDWLMGVLVSCEPARIAVAHQLIGTSLCGKITINRDIFFLL